MSPGTETDSLCERRPLYCRAGRMPCGKLCGSRVHSQFSDGSAQRMDGAVSRSASAAWRQSGIICAVRFSLELICLSGRRMARRNAHRSSGLRDGLLPTGGIVWRKPAHAHALACHGFRLLGGELPSGGFLPLDPYADLDLLDLVSGCVHLSAHPCHSCGSGSSMDARSMARRRSG